MKAQKILIIMISIVASVSVFLIISSCSSQNCQKPAKQDCKWKCNEVKKQCECTGKDCQICTGKKDAKAYGAPIVIGISVCKPECNWVCKRTDANGACKTWKKECMTVCRGE